MASTSTKVTPAQTLLLCACLGTAPVPPLAHTAAQSPRIDPLASTGCLHGLWQVGGHYFTGEVTSDPWTAFAPPYHISSSITGSITTGATAMEIARRAVIVHGELSSPQ